MFSSISWPQFFTALIAVVLLYYTVIGWMYRKDLLQWLNERKKR